MSAASGTFYGRERFDPGLVLAQIVVLQAAFYVSFTCTLLLFDRVLGVGARVSSQIFDHRALTLHEFGGWVTACALVTASAGPTAVAYVLLVGRAKRCLDFAVTIFVAHAIATTCHSGVPTSLVWWCVILASLALLAIVGEALCMKLELAEIALPAWRPLPAHAAKHADLPADSDREKPREKKPAFLLEDDSSDVENVRETLIANPSEHTS